MVEQRPTNHRLSSLIYLVFLLLAGCDKQEYTLVELHHISSADIKSILEQHVDDDIQYDIAGQSIIFHSNQESIKNTIALLQALDKGQSLYKIDFSWGNNKRYSTTRLPSSIYIKQSKENLVRLFNERWQIQIETIDQNRVLCEITLIKKHHLESVQQYVFRLGEAQSIEHPELPDGLALKIRKI
ncbi:MAG: hypothetical protein HWE18_07790 [Gammaproteobacteria bacterium]|nr:hypothetical protein [Gammaproteobacteria bacterium]